MLKTILQSLITKGLVAVLNFVVLILTSRYLGVSSRGEISIFVLNITIIQLINEIYTGYSLIHFIPKFNLKKLFVSGIVYTFLFTSLCNALIVFIHKQISGFEWLGYLISLLIILNTFQCVLLLGKEKVAMYNVLSFLQPLLLLGGIFFSIFIVKEYTFKAYVYPLLISFTIAFLISLASIFNIIFNQNLKGSFQFKSVWVNGLISQTGLLMFFFCNHYSYYLLADTAKVGLYSSASTLTESVLIIANSIAPVLLARIANEVDSEKNVALTLSLSKLSLLFSGLMIFAFSLLPDQFFTKILGEGFAGIKPLMMAYSPGILMISVSGIISNYFLAKGQTKLILLCNSVGFIFTLIFAPLLIKKYDILGAAYAANVAYFSIGLSLCSIFIFKNKLSLHDFFSWRKVYGYKKNALVNK